MCFWGSQEKIGPGGARRVSCFCDKIWVMGALCVGRAEGLGGAGGGLVAWETKSDLECHHAVHVFGDWPGELSVSVAWVRGADVGWRQQNSWHWGLTSQGAPYRALAVWQGGGVDVVEACQWGKVASLSNKCHCHWWQTGEAGIASEESVERDAELENVPQRKVARGRRKNSTSDLTQTSALEWPWI